MNDISFLQILYRNRIRLLVVSLAVAVVGGVISYLVPNKYSSTAAITIQRPEVPITGEISPLRVEALRSLTESTQVKRKLIEQLHQAGLLEERIDFRRFQKMLSIQVEHVEGRERTLLPMVKLTAITPDPTLSAEIANQWAKVVLDQTADIYRTSVAELGTFTNNIYEEVSRTLLEKEGRYARTKLESQLIVKKPLLEHSEEIYSSLSKEVLQIREKVATKKMVLGNLEETLAAQEIDGIWIGEFFASNLIENSDYTLDVTNPLAERITRTIRRLFDNERAEAEFNQKSQLDNKNLALEIKRDEVKTSSASILKAQIALSSLEPKSNKLREELQGMKPVIIMNKALTDEAIIIDKFEDIAKGGKWPVMVTEEHNPVYEETQQEKVQVVSEVNGLQNQVLEGEKALQELRKEINDLAREVAPLRIKRRELGGAIEKDEALLNYYRESYYSDRQQYESLAKEIGALEAELKAKQAELDSTRENLAGLEEAVVNGEAELARQLRDVNNLSQVRSSLAAKAAEVALLRVSMENVSRSGTVLLYGAGEDPLKIAPSRGRIVLVAFLLTFLIYSLILILGEVVGQTESRLTGEAP